MKITILSGVPGSGKSTFAAQDPANDVISADHFFQTGPNQEYQFDATKLGTAHAECLRRFVDHVTGNTASKYLNHNIVVDNTNTTAVEIAPYYALAQAYGHEVEILTVTVPDLMLHVCAERNAHGVPLKSIERMQRNLQNRKLMPFWNARTIGATF